MLQMNGLSKYTLLSLSVSLSLSPSLQERLMALRERALRKNDDSGRRLSNMSDSMESLKSLGPKLAQHKELRPQDMSTPLVTPTKDVSLAEISGSEKLQMLNQRTEQNRALIEQRKRDLAKSLQSVKSGLRHSASSELGSSMSDLRVMAESQAAPVSRHRSAADLLQQQQQTPQQLPASDESRLKMLKNKMKLIEMKQTRKEQELQQELLDLRNELSRRDEVIQQQEITLSEQSNQLSSLRPLSDLKHPRLQAEIEQLRDRNAELEASSEMLETTRHELQTVREQLLLEQQATSEASANSTDAQVNQELAKQLQELENQLQELREANAQKEEAEQQREQDTDTEAQAKLISELEATIAQQSEQLAEKTTELNVLNVNLRVLEEKLAQSVKSKPIFLDEHDGSATEQLQGDLVKLKQKLDECNKSNIKLKLKCKQAEKQLQKFQSTDTQQELARIRAENEQLQQRITVLEDEKGQWQLAQVDEEPAVAVAAAAAASSGQTEAIRLLEEQKQELEQALEALQQGTDAARVESELNEVQLEEQLSQRVQQLEAEANEQREQLQKLQGEKETLDKKLSHYINENMELLDKLEKLSSSSSAESIEIVERPTERRFSQQRPASEGDEPAEVEPSSSAALPSFVSELTQTDLEEAAPEQLEMNESLAQLRTESDELLQKIQLFTDERREVLAKMEQLQAENATLQQQLKQAHEQSQAEQAVLQSQLEEVQRDKQQLSLQLTEKSANLSQELSSMQRSSEVVASLDCGAEGGGAAPLFDKCERSLSKLSSELEAYRKANDRNAKLNVSKKLAKEAKNVHTQLTELLHKVKEASTAVETVTVVETVVAVTAPNGKALAEYEQLTAQNAELKAALARLQAELEELRDSYPDEPVHLAIAQHEEEGEQRKVQQELEKLQQEREREKEQQEREKKQQERETELERVQLERELLRMQHAHDVERQRLQQSIAELQATIEELRATTAEQLQLIGSQSAELVQLQLQAEQHDQQLNQSEMLHEKYMEQQQRLRHELDARIETLEGEQSILQTLVAEQKQQLIEAYSQGEHELNLKLLELQQCQLELETSETRNKELREKLKKYALNLKKRTTEHAELEQQLKRLRAEQAEQPQQEEQLQAALTEQITLEMRLKAALAEQTSLELKLSEEQATVEQQVEQLQQLRDQLHEMQRAKKELERDLAKQHTKLSTITKLREEVDRLQVELQNTVFANTSLRQESYELEQQLEARAGYDELRRQLEQKSLKFDKSKEVIKLRNATIQSLQRELAELRAQLQAQPEEEPVQKQEEQQLQAQQQQQQKRAQEQQQREEEQAKVLAQLLAVKETNAQLLEEKANFELAIARLETLHEGIQAKLQQDQTYIESLEAQSTELQAKSAALEDQAASLTAEHSRAQEHVQLLEQQLRETSEQQTEHESQLQQRVQQLQEREQNQSRQLQQLSSEAEEARAELTALQATHDSLLARHKQQTQQAQAEREQLSNNSEQELHELRQQLQARDQELQRQRNVYDAKLAAKATELDEMECDLSAHMERATAETRDLTQQLERAQEQLQARSEEVARITDELADTERERATLSREAVLLRMQHDSAEQDVLELQELRMQAMQDKTEMDNLRAQIDSLCANHNQELQALQQQIAELDTLGQNQTDDQVYIETENKRLTEHLNELQARLEELQHQQHSQPTVPAPALFQTQSQSQPADDWMYSAAWQRQPGQEQIVTPSHNQVVHATHTPQNVPTAMFFGGDAAAAPSPFDEIVAPPLRVGTQMLGVPAPDPASMEPTIEDLQRNVSDLEKHAKELETKLLARNHALAEHEERRQQLERQLHEREQELAQLRAEAEERERVAAIEKLMLPEAEPVPVKANASTLDMFFGPETVSDGTAISLDLGLTQSEPVVESLIIPKKAYVCQPEQELLAPTPAQQPAIDWGVDMDEDPWASAAAAAVAEQPPAATSTLQARIDELEQQKAELQTKTAKLMKRLKEYRAKEQQQQQQQELMTMSKNMSNDLDSAIIDELKNQLQLHEARQSKTEELLQQHALEKEKLAKRIDVLTAGNERMAELKERQDMDVQMYQARIRELQEKLQQLESWGEEGAANVQSGGQVSSAAPAAVSTPNESMTAEAMAKIENLQAENLDLNTECQELQAQLQQEKQLVQDALAQAQREREQLQAEKVQYEQERQQLQEQLQQQLAELQAKQLEKPSTTPSDESLALLQEKESEIVHLKQRIEELMREDQTEKLVLEILTKNQELHMLRMQVKQLQEEEKHEKLEAAEVQETASETKQQLEQVQQQLEQVQQQLEQVQQQCQQLQQEKYDMEEELRVLNNHVLSSLELEDNMKQTVLELDTKNIELTELRKSLELLQQAQAQAQQPPPPPAQNAQPDLSALNKQWEALVEQKCSEVASIWQGHLQQREAAYEEQIAQLQQQQQQQTALPTTAIATMTTTPSTTESGAETPPSELVEKMQKALETQEMEIVTLKEQLAIRSAEYARLASQYDPFRLQNTLAGGAASGHPATGSSQDGQAEYVLKSDLDYALMMLHQREMRIEEMIIELVQLLDERDHLQLKLSDTLRQLEAERSRGTLDDCKCSIIFLKNINLFNSFTSLAVGSAGGAQGNISHSSAASGSPSRISIASSSDLVPSSGSDLKQK